MADLTTLLSPFTLGDVPLSNRSVMAPMTRCRAINNVPNDLMASYYSQRASAGLIITEGASPSRNGLGYARIPGLYSADQIAGWRTVTDAVHAKGGRIFVQMMHVGRIGSAHNLPEGGEIVAPSAIQAAGEIYTDQAGPQPHETPRAMTAEEVEAAIEEHVTAARNAITAGFDGVELHGANGYLIEQFLYPCSNQRDDQWGGSIDNRNRFALEVARRVSAAIGAGRVGIRLSPYSYYNDQKPFDETDAQYKALAEGLSEVGVAYIHIVDHSSLGAPAVPQSIKDLLRETFSGTIILSGGYDGPRAEADLKAGKGELVAFGRPFLANADLLERLQEDAPLNPPRFDLFYTPGAEGYTDYPLLSES